MKNLFCLGFVLLITFSLSAQSTMERLSHIDALTYKIAEVNASEASVSAKEALIVKELGDYLVRYQSSLAATELEKLELEGRNKPNCGTEDVRQFLEMFASKRFTKVPVNYIMSIRTPTNSCAIDKAAKIYNVVGADYLANSDICKIMKCHSVTDNKLPRSRGAAQYWAYTGVKRYFMEQGDTGWKYLCVPVDEKESISATSSAYVEDQIIYKESSLESVSSRSSTPRARSSTFTKMRRPVSLWRQQT